MQILSLFGFTKALFLFFFFGFQIPPSGHFIFLLYWEIVWRGKKIGWSSCSPCSGFNYDDLCYAIRLDVI